MKNETSRTSSCPDCDAVSRRRFLRTVGGGLALGAVAPTIPAVAAARPAIANAAKKPAETWVKALYDSLNDEQRKVMHFSFDHELRSHVANNWDVVDPKVGAIGKLYSKEQQEIIHNIFRGIVTEDGYERFSKQMKDDAGGFDKYTCAIFGKPGEAKFEWVFTGRHTTLRCDGNSVDGAAFGGPLFYGHAVEFNEKPDHPGNVWWHQSRAANKVFQALDGKQREKALLGKVPPDNQKAMRLLGSKAEIPGLIGSELSGDQKELLEVTLKSLMGMFRPKDVEEAMSYLARNGGIDTLRLQYFTAGDADIGKDGIWDCWRVEGPAFVWHFRGAPHVHVWVNVAQRGASDPARSVRL